MSAVGSFPGVSDYRRRTVRGPINPLDKSTVVSIYPREINEVKNTIEPGRFCIPAGSMISPGILVVGPSSWWKELDNDQPLLEIPTSSILIADSIVKDWCNGVLGCNMGDRMPGLFYLPGEISLKTLFEKHKANLDQANANQRRWYETLVQMADTLWARTNGNPLAISDQMRLAALELNLNQSKEWTKDTVIKELVRCKACGSLKNPEYPVCQHCKAIDDPVKAKALGLTFAQ